MEKKSDELINSMCIKISSSTKKCENKYVYKIIVLDLSLNCYEKTTHCNVKVKINFVLKINSCNKLILILFLTSLSLNSAKKLSFYDIPFLSKK